MAAATTAATPAPATGLSTLLRKRNKSNNDNNSNSNNNSIGNEDDDHSGSAGSNRSSAASDRSSGSFSLDDQPGAAAASSRATSIGTMAKMVPPPNGSSPAPTRAPNPTWNAYMDPAPPPGQKPPSPPPPRHLRDLFSMGAATALVPSSPHSAFTPRNFWACNLERELEDRDSWDMGQGHAQSFDSGRPRAHPHFASERQPYSRRQQGQNSAQLEPEPTNVGIGTSSVGPQSDFLAMTALGSQTASGSSLSLPSSVDSGHEIGNLVQKKSGRVVQPLPRSERMLKCLASGVGMNLEQALALTPEMALALGLPPDFLEAGAEVLALATIGRRGPEGNPLSNWDFDATLFGPSELSPLFADILHHWDLLGSFQISVGTSDAFGTKVCDQYLPNPYHNFQHAFSVLQACHHMCVTLGSNVHRLLCKVDLLALFLAALCHDMGHPGTNNAFQQQVRSDLAMLYNDISILENHHAAQCFKFLARNPDANILANLSKKDFATVRRTVCRSILCTDMSVHDRELAILSGKLQFPFSKESQMDRELLVSAMLHAADLSNPCRKGPLAEKWARLLAEEFLQQTEMETMAGISVSGSMLNGYQRSTEVSFITTVAQPYWATMAFLFPPLSVYVRQLKANLNELEKRHSSEDTGKTGSVASKRPKRSFKQRLSLNLPKSPAYLARVFSSQATEASSTVSVSMGLSEDTNSGEAFMSRTSTRRSNCSSGSAGSSTMASPSGSSFRIPRPSLTSLFGR